MKALADLQQQVFLLLTIRKAGIAAAEVADLFQGFNDPSLFQAAA